VAVVTLAVRVPEENVVGKQIALLVTETWECLRKTRLEIKMAQVVTEPSDCLTKAYLDIKMARLDQVVNKAAGLPTVRIG